MPVTFRRLARAQMPWVVPRRQATSLPRPCEWKTQETCCPGERHDNVGAVLPRMQQSCAHSCVHRCIADDMPVRGGCC